MRLDARAIAPFTTGLGNEHPLENGFAFLNPYGLPYLPGSGVKGVLRQAAHELASGEWDDSHGWSEEPCYPLLIGGKPVLDAKKQPVVLSMLDVLFGRETSSGESDHVRGALMFWDVIPQVEGDSLMVEIMTPHQGHYYQWKKDQRGNEIEVPPHESGQPNPISFLTVPPGSRFVFHVRCDLALLGRLAPDPGDGRAVEDPARCRLPPRLCLARLRRQDGGGVWADGTGPRSGSSPRDRAAAAGRRAPRAGTPRCDEPAGSRH